MDWSIQRFTHQCVWKHILCIITKQHVAAVSPFEPLKHTNLGTEANCLLLPWWCLSNTGELHIIPKLQAHLQSPEEGCIIHRIQLKSDFEAVICFMTTFYNCMPYHYHPYQYSTLCCLLHWKSLKVDPKKTAYQDWNSALVHSNLWSLCLKPASPGRRGLNSEFGVLTITAAGVM